jgi:dolichol kinase
MEQQSQNTEGIKVIGYAIIPIHLFFAYFLLFRHSTNIAFLDNIYLSLNPKIALIKNPFFAHFIALILFSIHALTTPIGKDRELVEKTVIRNTIFGLITIFLASLLFFALPYSALDFFLLSHTGGRILLFH